MKVYKITRGWALFYYISALGAILVFSWALTLPFQNGDFSPNGTWILIPISIFIITKTILGLPEIYKRHLIISNDRIKSVSSSSTKELKIEEIKGYKITERSIVIEPNISHKQKIEISGDLGDYDEILAWCSRNLVDLYAQSSSEEEKEILNDKNIGFSRADREEKLSNAKSISKSINFAAWILSFWCLFYPKPYQYSILFTMMVPIVALLVIKTSSGLIRVEEKKGTAYPSVAHALTMPSMALLLRAILDFDIFEYRNVLVYSLLITLVFLAILFFNQKEISIKENKELFTFLGISASLFAYSFGSVIHYNCCYDESNSQNYTAVVLDKEISGDKTKMRYLELSAWGPQKETKKVSVGKNLYNRTEIGNQVTIKFRKGSLDIPWFEVSDKLE